MSNAKNRTCVSLISTDLLFFSFFEGGPMKNIILTIGFLCATYHNSFVDDDDGSEKQPNHQNTSRNVKRELENVGQTDLMVLNNRRKLIVCERGYRAHQHQRQRQQQQQQPQNESNTYRRRAKKANKTSLNGSVVGANCCQFKES